MFSSAPKPLPDALPRHVAVIMDGNGRWATRRGLPRIAGHKQGIESARTVVRHCGELGIQYLTLFGFSTENWKRPEDEVADLMGFLRYYLKAEMPELVKNNVRLRVIGYRHRIAADIIALIEQAEQQSAANTGLQLTIALDYGAQQEMVEAVREIVRAGIAPEDITDETITNHLMTRGLPEPDLVVRTSGEHRISNFLLWQSAYAEFYFTDTLWPDFGAEALDLAIADFARRERRHGGVGGGAA